MPDGASKLRDVEKLADAQAAFDYDLAVEQLPGFPLKHTTGGGRVKARVRFAREQGWPRAEVELDARVEMICQRCLRPMDVAVSTDSPVVLVESEAAAQQAPAESETFLLTEAQLRIDALVAEELLLALPLVPLHPQCEPAAGLAAADTLVAQGAPPALDGVVTRPFADLRALLERGGKNTK